MDETAEFIISFLTEIGISVTEGDLAYTFLPGIEVRNGGLIVDKARLKYPGDLLHEAAHLAVAPASIRATLNGEVIIPGTEPPVLEVAAMLWSYAACIHLGLDPRVVFHEHGYHGQSMALLQSFELGVYPGVNALVDAGITDGNSFPKMQRWLRD